MGFIVIAAARDTKLAWLAGGLAAAAVFGLGLCVPSVTERTENFLLNRVQRASAPGVNDIVLIDIDQASEARLGAWPWAHSVHASLVERLRAAQAKVITFTSPLEGSLVEKSASDSGDDALVQAIRAHGNVVLPVDVQLDGAASQTETSPPFAWGSWAKASEQSLSDAVPAWHPQGPSPALINAARLLGHTASRTGRDGVERSDLAMVNVEGHPLASLAVASATLALTAGELPQLQNRALFIGRTQPVSVDDRGVVIPRYIANGGTHTLPHYPYWQVLAGSILPQAFKDKVVFIGFGPDVGLSQRKTPAGTLSQNQIVASVSASLLSGTEISRPHWTLTVQALVTLIAFVVAAFAAVSTSLAIGATVTALLTALLLIAEIGIANSSGVLLSLALPVVALVVGMAVLITTRVMLGRRGGEASSTTTLESLRMLGLTFQGQGQLDLAFETFRRCPLDDSTQELLYRLGLDFERRRQLSKATAVYKHIAAANPDYRDLTQRLERLRNRPHITQPVMTGTALPADPPPRPAAKPEPPAPVQRTNSSGRTLGRYEIERELGKGAMGVVYLGRDPKINRVVAIKAIPLAEEFDDEDLAEARARFFREAEMAGRLNHPGIVTVYDAGEDSGLAYIAMEYLRGQHLSHYAEPEHLLPTATVLSLVARVADALNYAHRQNVVHRDIKPANIMFNAEADELKITDFGIARLTDVSRTKTGIVLGTPSFMSPEQLEGRPLDGRSDLFALGVTLYQLLSGQLPFRADSMTRLMQKIANDEHAPVRSIRPELPESIEVILNRILAKSADDRYQTGAELAAALRTCLQTAAA